MSTGPLPRTASTRADAGLDGHWWVRALALHERVPGAPRGTGDVDGPSRARLSRWRDRYGHDGTEMFDRRLAAIRLDQATLLRLLAEPPAALAARTVQPSWAGVVEAAVRRTVPPGAEVRLNWREALAWPLRTLVSEAAEQVAARLGPYRRIARLDVATLVAGFRDDLGRRLVDLAGPTLVTELDARRAAGRLHGANGRQRFTDFVRQLSEPTGLAELVDRYPVLARLLAQTSQFEAEALVEAVARFAEDRNDVVRTVFRDTDPGVLCRATGHWGDAHHRGRTVRLLSFDSGARIAYKPRDAGAQLRLGELVGWLNQAVPGLDLRVPVVLARAGYGWSEFVPHTALPTEAAAPEYYRRLGALLALLHVVRATDIHCGNVIAWKDQPVVVDAETLFHPTMPTAPRPPDPAVRMLADSVARTALLPLVAPGRADTSALAGSGCATIHQWESVGTDRMRLVRRVALPILAPSRPHVAGRAVEPTIHRDALLHGFGLGYDAVARDREGLTTVVRRCAGIPVRAVVRPTRWYRDLLDAAGRPESLRDGLDRDQELDQLWTRAASPLQLVTAGAEAIDLWAGDVPLFQTRPDSRDLWTSTGRRLPDVFGRPALDRVGETLRELSEVDRRDQAWIVAATLATRSATSTHSRPERSFPRLRPVAAPPQELLTAACAVADRIVAAGIDGDGRINWLGLEPVDDERWLLLPLGAGLAHGYLGVALYLAQLATLTGMPRYADIARRALRSYPALCRSLAARPELVTVVGCGGLSGLGGMAYTLARLATLLADHDLAALASDTVELAGIATTAESPAGWSDGLAGCLAAMLAVYRELRLDSAWRLAERCADLLRTVVLDATPGDVPDGFAHGWAGIGYALHRIAGPVPRYRPVAVRALELGGPVDLSDPVETGWCGGTAGRLVAQLVAVDRTVVADRGARAIGDQPVRRDLSLCHGELGRTEALTVLAGTGDPAAARVLRHRAGLVLDAVRREGPVCGTPGEVVTPGLLAGLAGIGYGLLRLGFAAEVPSVLLLEEAGRSCSRR
ncbi:type 2 lanthipeptide synthetase LanM family protein [Micromonospora sp. NPDC023956]|uniref:type 2 lanthipeptide synthetase LanM family protein n=1 Tax=Micromonospora sp. NPDC023956 TaxID=3155722 RepID=UPI00340908D7